MTEQLSLPEEMVDFRYWPLLTLFCGILILVGFLWYKRPRSVLRNTKFFGLSPKESPPRELYIFSLAKAVLASKRFPFTIDEVNNEFLGTNEGDIYNEETVLVRLKDWLEFDAINLHLAKESLAFLLYLKMHPDSKYDPNTMREKEGMYK